VVKQAASLHLSSAYQYITAAAGLPNLSNHLQLPGGLVLLLLGPCWAIAQQSGVLPLRFGCLTPL
jgi:hypothetical protein